MDSVAPRAAGRLEAIDALRGVAIAAVVALHTSWSLLDRSMLGSGAGHLLAALHLGAAFGVPLFLGLSAFGLTRRHDFRREGAVAFGTFLIRRARQLLPAYVAWSLLSAAVRDPALLATPGRVLSLLIDGSGGAQFYFVPMLFELYLWWPLLGLLVPRRSRAAGAALVATAALVSWVVWQGTLHFTWTLLCLFALYVAGGMTAATLKVPPRRACKIALGVALLAAAVALRAEVASFVGTPWGSDRAMELASTIFQPLAAAYTCAAIVALAAAALLASPSAPLLRSLATLGRAAYGVFLCHLSLAQLLVHPLLGGNAAAPSSATSAAAVALRFAIEWSLTLGVSAAISLLLARSARTRWLVGAGVTDPR